MTLETSASVHSSPGVHPSEVEGPLHLSEHACSIQRAPELLSSWTSLEQEKAQLCPYVTVAKMSHLQDGTVLASVDVTLHSHSHIDFAS